MHLNTILALILISGVSCLNSYREQFRPDFQTGNNTLNSGYQLVVNGTTDVYTGKGYRNVTVYVPFVSAAIDKANRLQCAINALHLFYNFSQQAFVWDVSIKSINWTSMSVHIFVNGSNTISQMSIGYLISTNLYFEIGYYSYNFAGTINFLFSK